MGARQTMSAAPVRTGLRALAACFCCTDASACKADASVEEEAREQWRE